MSEKRFNTDELVNIFNNHSVDHPYYFGFNVVDAIIARLRAGENLENKSLMKLASDLGVSFSAAKILEDHVRTEYDVKITKADRLCESAKKKINIQVMDEGLWFIAQTAPEAYLQKELRELHSVIEKVIAEYEAKEE